MCKMKKWMTTLCLAALMYAPAGAQEFLKGKILYFDTEKDIAERGGNNVNFSPLGGISASNSISLLSVERALDKAADDNDIAMVFLRPDLLSTSLSGCEEIRESLKRFRAKGKPVISYGISFDNGSYYLGSVADKVFMHPDSEGILTGLSTSHPYYKDLLDSLGIQVQLIRHGSYKSAGEPYVRNEMSPENREQNEVLLSSIWNPMVEEMASSRGIPADTLRSWIDALQLDAPEEWLRKGLVDGLKYRDEMEDYLCRLFGKTNVKDLKKVSVSKYAETLGNRGADKVAVLYAEGDIVRSGKGLAGETFARTVAKVRADSSVKAVVLRVNSPGGEVVASDIIRREIELLKKDKPVIASYGAYAASGGYLISAGADRIFVDNSTLTGSIGVFGMNVSYRDLINKKLHTNIVTIGVNAHSDLGTGFRPLDAEELAWRQAVIDDLYDDFIGVVSRGRGMDRDAVDEIARGRVWSGMDATRIGLADERGTLLDAVKYAAGCAGLNRYRIAVYPEKKKKSELLRLLGIESGDKPLVRLQEVLPQGFSTVSRMPDMEF